MSNLLTTFNKIDAGRRKCINNLKALGSDISETASLNNVAQAIADLPKDPVADELKDYYFWERPTEWPDTAELLRNAPEIEGHTAFALYLLRDTRSTVQLYLYPVNNAFNCSPSIYYMSDGTMIENSKAQTYIHTWNKDKDIDISFKYKVRYIILYVKNAAIDLANSSSNYTFNSEYNSTNSNYSNIDTQILEVCTINPTNNENLKIRLFKGYDTTSNNYKSKNIYRIHLIGNTPHIIECYDPNYGLSSRSYEIEVDFSGTFQITRGTALITNKTSVIYPKLILPNITKVKTNNTFNDNAAIRCSYLYAPNLETIEGTKTYSSYLYISALLAYVPKLKSINAKLLYIASTQLDRFSIAFDWSQIGIETSSFKKDPVFEQISDSEVELVIGKDMSNSSSSYYLYNEHIKEITNTTALSINYYGYILPNLTKLNYPGYFNKGSAYTFIVGEGFKSNLDISTLTYLSSNDIMDLLYKLADVTNEDEEYTIMLPTNVTNWITDEEKAIATNKGWVIN